MSSLEERLKRRRFIFGAPDALRANILDTVDQVDKEGPDSKAVRDLLTLADMHAEAFTPEFIEQLATDAVDARHEALLKTVSILATRIGVPPPPRLLEVAREGLLEYWGQDVAIEILAAHGTTAIFDDERVLNRLIDMAGPSLISIGMRRGFPQPEALLRLYLLDPQRLLGVLIEQMSSPDKRRRIRAAVSTRELIMAHPSTVEPLIQPLIETLLWAEPHAEGEAKDALRATIGDALSVATEVTEVAIDAAWHHADRVGRLALLEACEDAIHRVDLWEISEALADTIVRRALTALTQVEDAALLYRAADTLKSVCQSYADAVQLPFDTLFGVLADLGGEPPPTANDLTEGLGSRPLPQYRGIALEAVSASIISLAWKSPQAYWAACQASWRSAPEGSRLRLHLAHIVATLTKHLALLDESVPLLEEVLTSDDIDLKTVILWNLATQPWTEGRTLPAAFAKVIIDSVCDDDMSVVEPAVEAILRVSVPAERIEELALRLASWANKVAGSRGTCRMAKKAIDSAVQLAKNQPFQGSILDLALSAIRRMYVLDGVEALRWRPELQGQAGWLPTVAGFFAAHEDQHYWQLSERYREHLAREIAALAPECVAPYLGVLVADVEASAVHDPGWAWYMADIVSGWGFYSEAASIAHVAWSNTPDDAWYPMSKQDAWEAMSCFQFEAAIARGDLDTAKSLAARWRPTIVQAKARAKEMEEKLARILAAAPRLAD